MGVFVSKMGESIEARIQASLNTAQDHDGGPYPCILAASLGTKFPARWAQGRSFTTTSFREPISLSAEENGQCTEDSYSCTSTEGTFKDSSCTLNIVQGSVTGYKDVSIVGERTLMSAVARQPVSTVIEADLCSFQLHMSGVLCSRGTVPSVEVKLVQTSAAKPAEFEGECRTLTSQSPSTLTSCLQSPCTPVHLQPTMILMIDGLGSSVLKNDAVIPS